MPVVLLALCLACTTDLFGVETRVPSADRVERLSVTLDMGYPGDSASGYSALLTEPEDIQRFIDLHQAIVDDRDRLDLDSKHFASGEDYAYLHLEYTLKRGSTLSRSYNSIPIYREDLGREGSVTSLLDQLCGDRELVAQAYGFEHFIQLGRLTGAWLDQVYDAQGEMEYNVYVDDYARELWDAVQADFAEGTIGVRYPFGADAEREDHTFCTRLTFSLSAYQRPDTEGYSVQVSPGGYDIDETLTITLTPNARHTLAVLDKTGIWEEGYSLAEYEPDYDPRYPDTAAGGGWEVVY